MRTADIRSAFVTFFEERGHQHVASSSLVPADDPTILFTNAGMVQFKDPLLGREQRPYQRAVTSQRCVRAGGKHNDLENVGYTARHNTFFEMLGNFSFGDYFKEETIRMAWTFLTEVLKLPKDKLWVTVHPTDEESKAIWIDTIGIDPARVTPLEENFWAMGETGPCGPCTEIFYDHGPQVEGGPPGSPDEDGDRYVEFWNLVFPQFERSPDGELTPLPQPGVDTGMGLERVSAIMQGVHSNYEIDVFRNLMLAAGSFAGINDPQEAIANPSLRVIADHIRSSAFLIADGIVPGNEERAYVLRRIIRRALRHGYKLNIREPFFHKLVSTLAQDMGEAYPLIKAQEQHVTATLLAEEKRFADTLTQGMELLNQSIDALEGDTIPGEVVFQLYDTFGFPTDLTADVARERGLEADMAGFEVAMEAQRERARAAAKFGATVGQRLRTEGQVEFVGYEVIRSQASVTGLFRSQGENFDEVDRLEAGEAGVVVLDRTTFYAESGGQVGDAGVLQGDDGRFEVSDTIATGDQHLHIGRVTQGELRVGIALQTHVDDERRLRIMSNHSATHLLHAALREELGEHVQQRGSLVDAQRTRFDFSHTQAVTREQIHRIEERVNSKIRQNSVVGVEKLNYQAAIDRGAMALFGEKYGDEVRVLTMGDGYSVELCGGTHVGRTGDIGLLRIISESGIAAGVRRMEAVTGEGAMRWIDEAESQLEQAAAALKTGRAEVAEKVLQVLEQNRGLAREVQQLAAKLAANAGSDLAAGVVEVAGVKLLAAEVDGDDAAMMNTLDSLKSRLAPAVLVLGNRAAGKVSLVAHVGKDLVTQVSASDLVKMVGAQVGARGGGRPELARAGGGDAPESLGAALESVEPWLADRLADQSAEKSE